MSEPAYRIEHDAERGFIRATNSGFWTIEKLEQFVGALRVVIAQCRVRSPTIALLIDANAVQTQSAELGDRAVVRWQELIDRPGDRAAIVVESVLVTMQFKRLYESDRCRVFGDEPSARAWLDRPCGA